MILALAGGVGGAKLAQGLAVQLPPENLLVVVNTGDDFTHLGLHISPDLDTVMYWLAGENDHERGWGLAGETWAFMAALEHVGGPTWFKLGDRDLATHVERTQRVASGERLSEITHYLCKRFGIAHRVAPMSDDKVSTIVHVDEGPLDFQEYFVARRCEPQVRYLEFRGAQTARPSRALGTALADNDLRAIIICPSNPFLSIDPILQIAGVRELIATHSAPKIAVSPIIGGNAIKGPLAKMLLEMGRQASAVEIARHYRGLIDGFVVDRVDAGLKSEIETMGLRVEVTDTVMKDRADRMRLAEEIIAFASRLVTIETGAR